MFYGTVPDAAIQQIFKLTDLSATGKASVCCSGSFKVDRALRRRYPDLHISSNDVSLYSGALGALLTGTSFDLKFTGKLEFIEAEMESGAFHERVAAMLIAFEMGRFAGKNRYAKEHYRYYLTHFASMLPRALEKLADVVAESKINEYQPRDWREHVDDAIADNRAIVAFPPFFKGDYEQQFKFLDDNCEWPAPSYPLYDPKELGGILDKIHQSQVNYCVLTDQTFEDIEPVAQYVAGRKVPHFMYARTDLSSVRRFYGSASPVRYSPVDPKVITKKSRISVQEVPAATLDFLKDVYLAKGIIHSGGCANYLVTIDGMTVGGLIYDYPKFGGGRSMYLLSDVTICPEAKLSKLVAKLATSGEVIAMLEKKLLRRIDRIITTARSRKPVSMKYRGIFEKASIRPDEDVPGQNIIQYHSEIRRSEGLAAMFKWWWKAYGEPYTRANREAK